MKFDFQFGKKKLTIKQYVIVGIVLSSIIAALSQCTGVSQNGLWDLLDEIQRKYFPQTIINEFILKDPEKLKRRIVRDVDKAIRDVTSEYDRIIQKADQKYQPKYLEEPNDDTLCYTDECKSLAPPMRKCASWVEDCN
ncbi:hypothetical protein PQC13_gp280 [Synechococcus phage S-SRM01]|uniref:Uncharacterized protein n=1 Tax=Synechococcus phage S-SRM01 TaxID=2781608 RepID=A0A879R459_9CAUD|nr:hypothetical protein PQC13_gp280 [Synechococcus phage S-SRM01]QPX48245.1 hypothetical protein [Synechococcus phage S-SRM01]